MIRRILTITVVALLIAFAGCGGPGEESPSPPAADETEAGAVGGTETEAGAAGGTETEAGAIGGDTETGEMAGGNETEG